MTPRRPRIVDVAAGEDLDAELWSDDRDDYLWDDLHLNEAGHAELGDLLRPALSELYDGAG